MNLLILGCGNMGGAMLQAWLPLIERTWQEIWILRMAQTQYLKLQANSGYRKVSRHIHLVSSFAELQQRAKEKQLRFDQIIVGMKPQVIREQMANCILFDNRSLWLTIAAGLPLSWYTQYQAGLRILRMMPNLGAQVGQSATLLYKEASLVLDLREQNLLEQLAQSIGKFSWCHSESQLDNATPITGSGPAYFYLLTEALQCELHKQGFAPEEACELAEATFLGAAAYLANMRKSAGKQAVQAEPTASLATQLRQAVTSKAGVTEAALSVLTPQLLAGFAQAVEHGIARNCELQRS